MNDENKLVKVTLVPVEIHAECNTCETETSIGLSDAASPYSDCNRAVGHIYRLDESQRGIYRDSEDVITIYVPQGELSKFNRNFQE